MNLAFLENFFYPLILVALLLFSLITALCYGNGPKKIQKTYPTIASVLRDTWLSLIAPLCFLPSALLCLYLSRHNLGFIYHQPLQYGAGYFVFSLFLVTLVHDTYYYWVHRLLHTPLLFKKIHALHHRSHNPTVMAFFAMHPLESALMAMSLPLCGWIFPISDSAFNVAYGLYIAQAIYAHSGFEWFKTTRPSKWFNTSHAHNLHHQVIQANYGYFYSVWDRLLGTQTHVVPVTATAKAVLPIDDGTTLTVVIK